MSWFNLKKKRNESSVHLPIPAFKNKWANGHFDECDYYTLCQEALKTGQLGAHQKRPL